MHQPQVRNRVITCTDALLSPVLYTNGTPVCLGHLQLPRRKPYETSVCQMKRPHIQEVSHSDMRAALFGTRLFPARPVALSAPRAVASWTGWRLRDLP